MNTFTLKEAIKTLEICLNAGNENFPLNTEFGKLIIRENKTNPDPGATVDITKTTDGQYQVTLSNIWSEFQLKCRVVQTMAHVVFREIMGIAINDDIALAAVIMYYDLQSLKNNLNIDADCIMKDFADHNLTAWSKNSFMVQWLMNELFAIKYQKALEYCRGAYDYITEIDEMNHGFNAVELHFAALMRYVAEREKLDISKTVSTRMPIFKQTKNNGA